MKGKIGLNIQAIFLCIIGIFLLWMLVVLFLSMVEKDGLLEITEDNTCEPKEIGVTKEQRKVYSYCLQKVDLKKVMLEDGIVSDSLLIKNLKQRNCLYDGGTCAYYAKNYQIISCQKYNGNNALIITTKSQDFQELYSQFCSIEETPK